MGPHGNDRRQRKVELTDRGRHVYDCVERMQSDRRRQLLEDLPERQQRRLVHAMEVIEEVLTRPEWKNLYEKAGLKVDPDE